MDDFGRKRNAKAQRLSRPELRFTNPYPWMSSIEAMVHLALESHYIPFSWRFFDGQAPTFTQLMTNQGYQPEFTLREYRTVVLVQGAFFGSLPGVLDNVSLAKVLLEADLWKVVILWESDIRTVGAWELLRREIPMLGAITGPPRANPYGQPDLMSRSRFRGQHRPLNPRLESIKSRLNRGEKSGRRSIRRAGHRFGDTGRRRVSSQGAVSSGYRSR